MMKNNTDFHRCYLYQQESQPIEESPRVTEEGLGESAGPLQAQLASKAVPHITEEEHSIIVEVGLCAMK